MVGDAERIVSPSSSSTRRSTPCVLGCWGPMLTVIISVLMSGISLVHARPLHDVADHVQQRPVHFLHPRRESAGTLT